MIKALADAEVMGLLTLISAIAAILAAYLSWSQLRGQKLRWRAEDNRIGPEIFIGLSGEHSGEGWFHGVWQVTNRAGHDLELFKIEARNPSSLTIGELDPASDGPVATMKVVNPARVIEVSHRVRASDPPGEQGLVGKNFMYRISSTPESISSTPESSRGTTIRLRFHVREADNPTISYVREASAVVPRSPTGK